MCTRVHTQPSLRERNHTARSPRSTRPPSSSPPRAVSADTTVDAIAERAGVSRRTFFNYYARARRTRCWASPPRISEAAHARYIDREHRRRVRAPCGCSWTYCGTPPAHPSSWPSAAPWWTTTPSSSAASGCA
ncbi:TetR family transcriptional regulator [Kocuria rhizophila]|nr:TetR family transcriptional regulator [Kocuria rhizophila]